MNTPPLRALALATAFAAAAPATALAVEYDRIDPAASRIAFAYKQMGVGMDGGFGKFGGQLRFDPARPDAASARLELQLASIDTGFEEGNEEVRNKAWLDTATHPVARFESSSVKALGGNRFELAGKLTIKGRTRDVVAPLSFTPQGKRAAFDGAFTLKRADFAIGEGQWADFGLVANEVQIKFHIVATPSGQ